jgi:acyl-coenzyme A thioesterase PaaI-like protein
VKVVRSWRTRNYMGTTFGGSIYAAVDPLYAMMLINVLGDGFEVWDKSASIRFRKPVEETLYARCRLPDDEIREIRDLDPGEKSDREYGIDLVTAEGEVHATVEKTVHVRREE